MKTLTAIIGAMALASFGCGDDTYAPADADIPEETAPAFTFEGDAAYCISHSDEMSTCVSLYADMQISAMAGISKAWLSLYTDHPVRLLERSAEGDSLHYDVSSEMCIRGSIAGVELLAEDIGGNQGSHIVEEVPCESLGGMFAEGE